MKTKLQSVLDRIVDVEQNAAEILKDKRMDACPHIGSVRSRLNLALESTTKAMEWVENNPDLFKDTTDKPA